MAKFEDTTLRDKNKNISEANEEIALVQKDHFKHLKRINRINIEKFDNLELLVERKYSTVQNGNLFLSSVIIILLLFLISIN